MESFQKLIEEEKLVEENDKILVALSGGPDSVALLRLLLEIKDKYKIELGLCHINHMLRGENSDGDEEFCKRLSQYYKIPFYSLRANIEAYGKEKKIGLEEAGREIRYEFFNRISTQNSYNKIALAHNLDDNVETFLFRLIRGTGINGLKGIPVKRDKIIRPLLNTKKSDILDYLSNINQEYRIDESNNEKVYSRNKIRLDLIPYIEKEFNPNFKESITSLINDFSFEEDFEILDNKLEIEYLNKLSKAKKGKLIYSFLKFNDIELNRNKVEEIINILEKDGYKEISLGRGLTLKKSYKTISIEKEKREDSKKSKIQLDIPDKIGYNGHIIEVMLVNKPVTGKNCFNFDYDKITEPLYVRTKNEGDKFLPVGMESYKKLKKFFIDQKVEKEKREEIPIIFSGDEILLIGNLRSSRVASLTENSNNILLLKVEEGVFSER